MIDLVGQKFGRLFVIKKMDNSKNRHSQWLCRCECGKEKIIRGDSLKNENTKSCGCLHIEISTKHGHRTEAKMSETYHSWNNMIQRCTNPKNEFYYNYGGRGITVCKRWLNFENFLKDMDEVPKKHQIDRINNNGNYCKDNCKWSTRTEQGRNKRNNRLETYNGKTQCLIEWVEEFGISYSVLWDRLYKLGWSIKKALTTPVKKRRK